MINRFILLSDDSRTRKSGSNGLAELRTIASVINFGTARPFGPTNGYSVAVRCVLKASSRLRAL